MLPRMFGVLELRESPESPSLAVLDCMEELLLLEVASLSKVLSFIVSDVLISNSLGNATLKIESVGTLGVDSSKPPYIISCLSCSQHPCLNLCML
jgi:hypothetical protein